MNLDNDQEHITIILCLNINIGSFLFHIKLSTTWTFVAEN